MSINTAVVLGFYKNDKYLWPCLESLKKQTYKDFDIYIYDNSCVPNALKKLQEAYPQVKIKVNNKNLGFAGGNNSVIREVLQDKKYKYIILLNDDTAPKSEWIENLLNNFGSSKIGAVTSKLVYYEPFVKVALEVENSIHIDSSLGFTSSDYTKKFWKEGSVYLPIGLQEKSTYTLTLNVKPAKKSSIKLSIGTFTTRLDTNDKNLTVDIPADIILSNKFNIIQNASSALDKTYSGYDVGNGEIDKGQYNNKKDAEMFCGGAVALKREALIDVGIFDEYFFNYYEDGDLSLRMRKKGWTIIYEPKAVVRHIHSWSGVEWSPFFYYHVMRNKVVFAMKNLNYLAIYKSSKYLIAELIRNNARTIKTLGKAEDSRQRAGLLLKALLSISIHIPKIILQRYNIIKPT